MISRVWITAAMLACCTSFGSAQESAPATNGDLLSRVASLDVRDVSLQSALQLLSMSSGVSLAYSPDLLGGNGPVSCSCDSVTVRDALDTLLAGTDLRYVATRNRVVIAPPTSPLIAASVQSDNGITPQLGTLRGEVRSATDSQPVPRAQVTISTRSSTLLTDADGRFQTDLRPGAYQVAVRALGYAPQEIPEVLITDHDTTSLQVLLDAAAFELRTIVVTPSTYGVLGEGPVITPHTLTREEVQTRPHFGEDVYRTLDRLPGVTTDDISAKLHIRGGPNDQVLELFDGLQLYEPFHLKDIDGALSIIDVESVADVSLMTGGFGAEYGDKMTGVVSMQGIYPRVDRVRTTLGLSFMNATFKSEGGFADGRGGWVATARRGYLDLVLAITDATDPGVEVSPRYYDLYGKVQYQLGSRHLLSGNLLHAGDRLTVVEEDGTELDSEWNSTYGWLNLTSEFSRALSARTILSLGRLTRERIGADFDGDYVRILDVVDNSTFDFYGFKQDWDYLTADWWLLKWGFDARHGQADYDYFRWWTTFEPNTTNPFAPLFDAQTDTVAVVADTAGFALGAYLSNRLRPIDPLTLELGMRYDHHTHTEQGAVSPRVNLALQLGRALTVRGAWGYYYQSQGLHELQASDGDSVFYPAQRAEHWVAGVEYQATRSISVRVEGYRRSITDPRPEYRSLEPQYEVVWEEGPRDRVRIAPTRGRAMGLELFAKQDVGRFVWSVSYALAAAEDEIDSTWVPRPYDQRHTLRLEFAYRPNAAWSLGWAWQYHTPWPATAQVWYADSVGPGLLYFDYDFGPLYAERLPPYHRLDLRVTRHFQFSRSRLSVYVDVFNLYDRENAKAYDYFLDGTYPYYRAQRTAHALIGVLPTIGARWEF
jgi:hypothetical protein